MAKKGVKGQGLEAMAVTQIMTEVEMGNMDFYLISHLPLQADSRGSMAPRSRQELPGQRLASEKDCVGRQCPITAGGKMPALRRLPAGVGGRCPRAAERASVPHSCSGLKLHTGSSPGC